MKDVFFEYSKEKNLKLLAERGVGFEDIISMLDSEKLLAIIDHPNQAKYPFQKIYGVGIEGYAYLIPFERQGDKIILKTIFPSRKFTSLFQNELRGGDRND